MKKWLKQNLIALLLATLLLAGSARYIDSLRIRGAGSTTVEVGASGTLYTADFMTEVAKGNIPGHSLVRKFGIVEDLVADNDFDVWEFGDNVAGTAKYTFSPDNGTIGTADITLISSSDVDDTVAMTIQGLGADGTAISQDIILQGQTQVTFPGLWRVNRVFNANGDALEGDIYVYTTGTAATAGVPQTLANVRAFVNATDQQTLQGVYSVPLHCNAYILGLETSITHAGNPSTVVSVNCKGIVREFGKQFRTQDEFDLIHSGSSSKVYNFPIPLRFPARSDFVPQVNSDVTGVGVTWSYSILLVEDGY
jgi:hypothetical protein